MIFKIHKSDLLTGLQRIQNIVERRTTLAILSNALIKTEKNGLSISATDLEVTVQSVLPAEIMSQGSITVKARSLLDIVRELPDGAIYFELKDNHRLEIKLQRSTFNLVGLDAVDFAEILGFQEAEKYSFVRMNGEVVSQMLDKTLYAASIDEARYQLTGVFFQTLENKDQKLFRMVATDAHRLALVDDAEAIFENNAWDIFTQGVIVPKKGLSELRRVLSEGKEDFFISIKDKVLCIRGENILLSMRLIEGKYADYRRIIPEVTATSVVLDKEEFVSSLKRVSLLSTDKSKTVAFKLEPGLLELSSQSPELGDAKEEINVDYQGEALTIGFNSRYLIEALSTIDSEKVSFEVKGKQNPGVLRAIGGKNHTTVIMPMRL